VAQDLYNLRQLQIGRLALGLLSTHQGVCCIVLVLNSSKQALNHRELCNLAGAQVKEQLYRLITQTTQVLLGLEAEVGGSAHQSIQVLTMLKLTHEHIIRFNELGDTC
jgi:hypothetical protein